MPAMLEVPEWLNRNAGNVRKMGDPADSGLLLINYMCERIGIENLASQEVLDLGCGVRFTQSFINRSAPIGTYTGLEVDEKIIEFLRQNVNDSRFAYHHVDILNPLYNPLGKPLEADGPSPLGTRQFDIACMFSVITHQQPDGAASIFRFLRRHLKGTGHMFFSALIRESGEGYKELDPEQPGLKSSYSLAFMTELLEAAEFSIASVVDPRPNNVPIMTSFLCHPATAERSR